MVNEHPSTDATPPQPAFNISTALPYGAPDDGDPGRQQRGLAIAALTRIEKHRLGYRVPSQSDNGTYIVDPDADNPCCSCADFDTRQQPCKHVYAVQIAMRREDEDEADLLTHDEPMAVPFRQSWANYNSAQEHEEEHFVRLLRVLCDLIPQPPQTLGQPRLLVSDVVFAAGLKVYGMKSMRRSMTNVRDARDDGLMDRAPSRTSAQRYMGEPWLAPILRKLIEVSAYPLATVDAERDFAADSSGFGSKTYQRWVDKKWGPSKRFQDVKEAVWAKCHLMCGVRTNIITAAEVTANESADAPHLPHLVETTARNFTMDGVMADKAYSSKRNLRAVDAVGATPYILFKKNTRPDPNDELWTRLHHFFMFNQGAFLERYHLRSNAETTFHMVKAKFGAGIRAKTPDAMVNEVLLKLLCHNIVVLIHAMYDMGIDPVSTIQDEGTNGPISLAGPLVA